MLKKYNPKQINGSWNNIPFLGFMDGTAVEIEFAEEQVTTHVGNQGDVSAVLNANRLVKVTITLIQGSPTNGRLSPLVPDSKRGKLPTGAFSLKDLDGTTLVAGKDAFISKFPKIEFAKGITGRQWVFIIPECDTFNVGEGGN